MAVWAWITSLVPSSFKRAPVEPARAFVRIDEAEVIPYDVAMPGSFSRSRQLVRESFAIVRQDRELVWFPILSGIVSVLVMVSFALPLWSTYRDSQPNSPTYYLYLFLFYVISYFVIAFFNAGLVTCVALRFQGKNPTFRDGWNNAVRHVVPLFLWALLSSTVGVLLRFIENKSGIFGRIVAAIIGMAWSLVTYFVVPLLVLENFSLPYSVRRSGELFKKTWGENVIGNISMNLVFFAFGMAGLAVGGMLIGLVIAVVKTSTVVFSLLLGLGLLLIIFFVVLGILQTTLQGVFNTSLYIYAQTGQVMPGLSPELVQQAFRPKKV